MTNLGRFIRDEEGQGIVEYAMILGLVGLIVALALRSVGLGVETILQQVDAGIGAMQGVFGP